MKIIISEEQLRLLTNLHEATPKPEKELTLCDFLIKNPMIKTSSQMSNVKSLVDFNKLNDAEKMVAKILRWSFKDNVSVLFKSIIALKLLGLGSNPSVDSISNMLDVTPGFLMQHVESIKPDEIDNAAVIGARTCSGKYYSMMKNSSYFKTLRTKEELSAKVLGHMGTNKHKKDSTDQAKIKTKLRPFGQWGVKDSKGNIWPKSMKDSMAVQELSKLIRSEAGGESMDGKMAVGSTVLIRLYTNFPNLEFNHNSNDFYKKMLDIIKEKGQYSGYNDSNYKYELKPSRVKSDERASLVSQSIIAARNLLSNKNSWGKTIPNKVVHYDNPEVIFSKHFRMDNDKMIKIYPFIGKRIDKHVFSFSPHGRVRAPRESVQMALNNFAKTIEKYHNINLYGLRYGNYTIGEPAQGLIDYDYKVLNSILTNRPITLPNELSKVSITQKKDVEHKNYNPSYGPVGTVLKSKITQNMLNKAYKSYADGGTEPKKVLSFIKNWKQWYSSLSKEDISRMRMSKAYEKTKGLQ